jgi:hypothetical protein
MSAYHLAQLNIGRIKAPMDSPVMAGFANNLDRINALAEATPGFIWRLQTDEGDATAIRPFDDPECWSTCRCGAMSSRSTAMSISLRTSS